MSAPPPPQMQAPSHTGPAGARSAGSTRRVEACLADTILIGLLAVPHTAMRLAFLPANADLGIAAGCTALIAALLLKVEVIDLWRTGQTLGMRLFGIAWTRWRASGPPGANALTKALIMVAIGVPTLGVGVLVVHLVSRDLQGRSWLDRVSGITVIATDGTAGPPGARGAGSDWPAGALDASGAMQGHDDCEEDMESTVLESARQRRVPAVRPQAPDDSRPSRASAVAQAGSGDGGIITDVPWNPKAGGTQAQSLEEPPAPRAAPRADQAPGCPLAPESTAMGADSRTPGMVPLAARGSDAPEMGRSPGTSAPGAILEVGGQDAEVAMDRTVAGPAIRSGLRLVLDTGQTIALTRTVLLGRDPQAVPPWDQADTVPVADPEYSISKTHLALTPDGAGAVVQDLGSTNGTAIVEPGGRSVPVSGEQGAIAVVGSTIRFGERSLTVVQ